MRHRTLLIIIAVVITLTAFFGSLYLLTGAPRTTCSDVQKLRKDLVAVLSIQPPKDGPVQTPGQKAALAKARSLLAPTKCKS